MRNRKALSTRAVAVNVFHAVVVVAIGMLGVAIRGIYQRLSATVPNSDGYPIPVIVTFIGVGILLLFTSVPGAFFGQPYWLADRIFLIVSVVTKAVN